MTLNNIVNIMLFSIITMNIDHTHSMNCEQNTSCFTKHQNIISNPQSPQFQNMCNKQCNSSINSKNNNVNCIFTFNNQNEDDSNNAKLQNDIQNNNPDTDYQNNICYTSNNNLSCIYYYSDYINNYSSIMLKNNCNNIICSIASSDNVLMQNTTNKLENNNHINSSIGSRSDDYDITYLHIRSRNDKHNESLLHINSENNNIKELHEKTTMKDNINLCNSIREELKKLSKDCLFSIDDSYLISKENTNKLRNEIESRMTRMLDTKNYDTIPYIKKSDKERTNDLCNNMIDYYNTHQMYIDKRKNDSIITDIPFTVLQIMYNTIEKYEPNIVDEAIRNIYIINKQQVLEWK